jgi:hypothetical protein
MKMQGLRSGRLTMFPVLALALGLCACLTSDAPRLSAEDLTAPAGFAGAYYATRFPEDGSSGPNTIDAIVESQPGRNYRLTFMEGEHKDEPVIIRFLTLNQGALLAVVTEADKDEAVYADVTVASNGAWVFRMVELDAAKRTRILKDALMRHGATAVAFDTGELQQDTIHGALSAANLRALFSDPDFVNALSDTRGFRLSPKH